MMNPEVKRQWVEALRSGNYKQWHGSLHNKHKQGFCCLGVLCDLSGMGTWEGDGLFSSYVTPLGSAVMFLPEPVSNLLGHQGSDREFHIEDVKRILGSAELPEDMQLRESVSLSGMNDCGLTFAQIADVIEALL